MPGQFSAARFRPFEWAYECPTCGAVHPILETEEDDAGVVWPEASARFTQCERCETLVEIGGAKVSDVSGSPWINEF